MAKKKVEIKGTKFQKVCFVLQVIVVILVIISAIVLRNSSNKFFEFIMDYGLYVELALLLLPYMISNK